MNSLSIPVAFGELIDKLTILEIKSDRISDPAKRTNVLQELGLLMDIWAKAPESQIDIAAERAQLKAVNESLWEIEDRIRLKEGAQEFDAEFIELARSIYFKNDERAAIKRNINLQLGSLLIEEKSYQDYRVSP